MRKGIVLTKKKTNNNDNNNDNKSGATDEEDDCDFYEDTAATEEEEPARKRKRNPAPECTPDATTTTAEPGHHHSACKRERVKATCTVSARMRQVVDQMVSCTPEQYSTAIQLTTVFAFKSQQSEIVSCFLEEMRRENGALMNNKQALLQLVDEAYERSQKLIKMHGAV
jgi:hypothetical protein